MQVKPDLIEIHLKISFSKPLYQIKLNLAGMAF